MILILAGDAAWVKAGPVPGFSWTGKKLMVRQVPRRGSGIRGRMNVRGANGATTGGAGTGPPLLLSIRP